MRNQRQWNARNGQQARAHQRRLAPALAALKHLHLQVSPTKSKRKAANIQLYSI
jgi:hypothetical protein